MRTSWLARRLGVDGYPLRRCTDKIASCAAALLLVTFLIAAPIVCMAVVGWAGGPTTAGLRADRPRHPVPAVLLQAAPPPAAVGALFGHTWVLARWTAPAGQARTGRIPVSTGLAAGTTVRLWVTAGGTPAGPPPNHPGVLAIKITAAATAGVALGLTLLCLAWAGRWALDRRRLADWEAAWATVGPQWTRRFRSRG